MPTSKKSSIGELGPGPRLPRLNKSWFLLTCGVLLVCAGASALAPGDLPPPIDIVDQAGHEVDLDDLKGKVVLVDFWASWCGPCKAELPLLEELHKALSSQGFVVVGVNIDRTKKKMQRFLESTPLSFRIVHDPKLEVASRYEPAMMPSSYVIGRDGKIRYIHEGFRKKDAATIESRIKTLLAEKPSKKAE